VAPQSRKRAADEDLIARLSQYEELMRKHNVDFTPYAHTWVSSVYEPKVKENLAESPSSPPPAHAPNRPTKQVTDSTGTQGDQ
jgi:lysozyme family protein